MITYHVTVNGKELTVRPGAEGSVSIDGKERAHDVQRISLTEFSVMIGIRQVRVVVSAGEEGFDVIAGDFRGRVTVESERGRLLRRYARSTGGSGSRLEVHAPMPAMVVRLEVNVGDEVRAGQPLIVLEAMKMENEIHTPIDGVVEQIFVGEGDMVNPDEVLVRIK